MQKICCFLGTDKIPPAHTVYTKLCSLMEKLIIKDKVTVFVVGYCTVFDSVACVAAVKLKEKYPHIQIEVASGNTESILKKCTHIAVYSYIAHREMLKEIKKENKKIKIYHLIS